MPFQLAPISFLSLLLTTAFPTPALHSPAGPPTKGQGQMAGGDARFGVIYTLKNDINFVIYSASYTLEPLSCYMDGVAPKADEKLLILNVAFKNAAPTDTYLNMDRMFTAVDTTGQLYGSFDLEQDSLGKKGFMSTLRPGQGIGQPELKDGLHIAFRIPGKARIVKIMVNTSRKLVKPEEKVFRYYIAGATKAEAGADGDPKNVIARLPGNAADPSDSSGAVALEEGKGVVGQELPSDRFHLKLNSVASTTDPITGQAPPNEKKYVVLNVTAKMQVDTRSTMFTVAGGDFPTWQITDTDGERYKPMYYIKASSKEPADHQFDRGDEYTFRVVFVVPKAVQFKKLVIGAGASRKWAFDGAIIQ